MEQLLSWDTSALLWINGHHAPWADTLMWWASQAVTWIPLYLWLIYLCCTAANRRYKGDVKLIALAVALSVACIALSAGLSDFVTSGLLKKTICRPRPTHSDIASLLHLVNGYTGGHYGFPSSHAANCWAVATSFMIVHRRLNPQRMVQFSILQFPYWVLLLYALINCYSRMYLGVHYPLDILVGTIIGILIALGFGAIFKICLPKLKKEPN